MAFQSQTYANSNSAYYGNPADWSNYSTINSTIHFNGTDATLVVIPAVPDSNTTITFNGNQLAYVSDIPDLANWAQYPANHDVDIPGPYVLNANVASISSLGASTIVTNDIQSPQANFTSTIIAPNLTVSTLTGLSVNVVADQGIFTATPSAIDLTTVSGSYGRISLTANPGQLNTLGGQVNMTANGGDSIGGLFGQVNITANEGTDIATGIVTGGKVNITANSGGAITTATSAINLNAGGINSYAGIATPIASLAGYQFINGTGGVSLCASVIPNSAFQVPGTCYLYGDTGITLGSDTYVTRVFPYWNGLVAPPNLEISGRATIAGNAFVVLKNVSSINGIAYPPPPASAGVATLNTLNGNLNLVSADNSVTITSSVINGTIDLAAVGAYNPNLLLSTLTMEPTTGIIYGNALQNLNTNSNDLSISQENATGGLTLTVSPISGPTVGDITINNAGSISFNEILAGSGIQINPEGNLLTFLQDATPADQGRIVGLSTINGQPLASFGAYNPNPQFSTIQMIAYNGTTLEGIISTDDLRALPGQPLVIRGGFSNADNSLINMGVTGVINFNNTNAGGVTNGVGLEVSAEGQNLTFPLDPAGLLPVGQILNLSTVNGQPLSAFGGYDPNPLFSTITINDLGNITAPVIGGNGNGTDSLSLIAGNIGSATLQSGISPVNASVICLPTGDVLINSVSATTGVKVNGAGDTLTFNQNATPANQGQIVGLSTINGVAYPPVNPGFVDSFQIYVAPNGNNTTGTGSQQAPFLTIAQAIIKRATIANTTEVAIVLSAGTYNETFTLTRNTFLVGVQTGEVRQPCNIVGNITLNDSTGTMGISGLEVTGSVSTSGGGAVYTMFGCNIANSATAVFATAGTVFITECRISTTAGVALISFSTLTVRDCSITTSGTSACISSSSITTLRQCVVVSSSSSTSVQSLIIVGTNTATLIIEFCRLEYTSTATDVGGQKCCIRFNNPTGTVIGSVSQSLLLCEGAITGSGGQIQCIQDTGAGAVNLAYGQLIAGATANHIAPTVTKTAYNPVP